ncbi:MAG TPA: DNA polymerase I [Longimicrobiaceae bacterium]|nr:DNA polymerase I [Longimicrobiaceae bacterium]
MDKPDKTRPRLYLIDGYALIYRAFFALIARPLMSSRGENTSAAWGVTRFLLKVIEKHEPDYLGMVFDAGDSERTVLYPAYKATREKMPDELELSLPRIRQLVEAFRIPVLELDGCEADDVIGTLAAQAADGGLEAVIVSGDKDFYQLIRPHVCLLNPGRGGPAAVEEEWVDTRNAHERLGVPPEHVVDYLGLIGDSSDNVPGVAGIGPKTAVQLIEEFGSIERILEHTAEIKSKRAREALEAFADSALLSKRLVTIRTDLPISLDLEPLRLGSPDRPRLKELFLELEFHSLVRDYAAPAQEEAEKQRLPTHYCLVPRVDEVGPLVERIRRIGRVAVDTETSSRDPMRAELCGISLAVEPGEGYYLPLRHRRRRLGPPQGELLPDFVPPPPDDGLPPVANLPDLHHPAMRPLLELLEDEGVKKIGQNLKYDYLVFRRAGVDLRGVEFDTMVASYLLEPGRREHGLDSLALQHLDHKTIAYEEVTGKGKDQVEFAEVELESARDYACEDADIALRLEGLFRPELERLHLDRLFHEVEMPLLRVLAEMEWSGIRIDEEFFAAMARELQAQQRAVEGDIYAEAGVEFNIGSTPQLREILFGRLGLPVMKRTKTGASTDVDVLQALAAQGHRLPTLLMQYRQLDKLLSTYVEALPRMVNPETGRIHTSFNQTVAATGRLSSTDPNLQNIPIRTELGAEIRRGFIPAEGAVFVSADYSQIELRILAHYSGDAAFVEAFRAGRDIHRETAALIFGVPAEQVTREMRDRAKTVNFAVIYGIGAFSLAGKLGVEVAEGKLFIDAYFQRFPGVRRYLDEQIERARSQGYVETLTGRRRYIPEIRARNFNVRSFGERAATNAPIQGSSADLIKIAMIDIQRELAGSGSRARMLLQVHDELLFEAPRGGEEELLAMVREKMEGAARLEVPLKVETGVGENWLGTK